MGAIGKLWKGQTEEQKEAYKTKAAAIVPAPAAVEEEAVESK